MDSDSPVYYLLYTADYKNIQDQNSINSQPLLKKWRLNKSNIMLKYELGEMLGANGAALRYEVEEKTLQHTLAISEAVVKSFFYQELASQIKSKKLILYFQFLIRDEIYAIIKQACVIEYYRREGISIGAQDSQIILPDIGIFKILKECWQFNGLPLIIDASIAPRAIRGLMFVKFARGCARRFMLIVAGAFPKVKNCEKQLPGFNNNEGAIACHYVEGIDLSRRSDIMWFPGSGIDPKRVLIYFTNLNHRTGELIKKDIVCAIEELGFRWVALKNNIIEGQRGLYWTPGKFKNKIAAFKNKPADAIEKWICKNSTILSEEIHYWRCFYDDFNIKVNFIVDEGAITNIAQAIAFDINKNNPGALVGLQRSEMLMHRIGNHPKHVFFLWSKRSSRILGDTDKINQRVLTGFPYAVCAGRKSENNYAASLKQKGADFIIALFDNAFGSDIHYSQNAMAEFYQSFLRMVIDNKDIGLIIKSKKPAVIRNLTVIHSLLKHALETGRCVRMDNEWGRFPSDASCGSDISIGCGISSAIIEAALSGCRGIHYDVTHYLSHDFYRWDKDNLIFNNLNKLLTCLEQYKNKDPQAMNLGDWSAYLDKLNPFTDAKGGERMGLYMRFLLEGFNRKMGITEAIAHANKNYASIWGSDKIDIIN